MEVIAVLKLSMHAHIYAHTHTHASFSVAVVSFAQPVYIALESEGSISISLTKEGNTVIAVNVVFRTVGNGTATGVIAILCDCIKFQY